MDFQDFLKYVPKLAGLSLPASTAHLKMTPQERIVFLEKVDIENINPKIAAVMMLLYPKNGKTHLVLIVRNSYPGVHSSQIAFPGGKHEPLDADYETTALRETQEEIGIHPGTIQVVMPLTNLYIPPSNFMVYPFLGICRDEIAFVPDPKEVAEIIELSLLDFMNDDLVIQTQIKTSYAQNVLTPAFKIKEHIVWGATAMMLSELKEVLKKVL